MLQEQVVQEKAGTLSPLKQSGVIKIKYYSSFFFKKSCFSLSNAVEKGQSPENYLKEKPLSDRSHYRNSFTTERNCLCSTLKSNF